MQEKISRVIATRKRKIIIIITLLLFSFSYGFSALGGDSSAPSNLFSSIFGDNYTLMYAFGNVANIFKDIFRSISHWFLMLAVYMVDGLGYVTEQIMNVNIFDQPVLNNLSEGAKTIGFAIVGISIVFAGFTIMYKGTKKIQGIFFRFFLVAMIITFLPLGMSTFFKLIITPSIDMVTPTSNKLGTQIVISQTYDVQETLATSTPTLILDGKISEDESIAEQQANFIARGGMSIAQVDQDEVDPKFKDYKSVMTPSGYDVEKMGKGWWGIGDEELYRYQYDYIDVFWPLIIMGIALIFFNVRLAKTYLFEIPISIITTILFFAPTSQSESKLLKILEQISMLAIGIVFSIATLSFYIITLTYVYQQDMMPATAIIVNLALAAALISGSRFVNMVSGIDTGVSDGYATVVATASAGRMLSSAGNMIKDTVKSVGNNSSELFSNLSGKDLSQSKDLSEGTNSNGLNPDKDLAKENGKDDNVGSEIGDTESGSLGGEIGNSEIGDTGSGSLGDGIGSSEIGDTGSGSLGDGIGNFEIGDTGSGSLGDGIGSSEIGNTGSESLGDGIGSSEIGDTGSGSLGDGIGSSEIGDTGSGSLGGKNPEIKNPYNNSGNSGNSGFDKGLNPNNKDNGNSISNNSSPFNSNNGKSNNTPINTGVVSKSTERTSKEKVVYKSNPFDTKEKFKTQKKKRKDNPFNINKKE